MENWIKENYKKHTKKFICEKYNISIKELRIIAKKLNVLCLKRALVLSNTNKKMGRDLTIDLLKNIALKYKSRSEFQYYDSSAYTTARNKGILNDICAHMLSISFSIPQLILCDILKQLFQTNNYIYNDRQTIKPLEIDIYFKEYKLAFEYNGKGWHLDNKNDIIKKSILDDKNIKLITIIENNRNYEQDIKEQLVKNINNINSITCNMFKEEDIYNIFVNKEHIFNNIINTQDIKNIASKYTTLKDFCKHEKPLYVFLNRHKLRHIYLNELITNKWTIDKCIENIKQYKSIKELYTSKGSCYNYIKKNKLDYLINHLDRDIPYFKLKDDLIILDNIKPNSLEFMIHNHNELHKRLKKKLRNKKYYELLSKYFKILS